MTRNRFSGVARVTTVGFAALAGVLTVGTALPSQAHAYSGMCYRAARNYRTDFNYEPPPVCWTTVWVASTDGKQWDRPLPPDQDLGARPPHLHGQLMFHLHRRVKVMRHRRPATHHRQARDS